MPNSGQYSQYVTVYVNKNGSEEVPSKNDNMNFRPKNIIESLALLDEESDADIEEDHSEKKLSKSKRKLAKLSPEKKWLVKKLNKKSLSKEPTEEPLLALS